MGKLKISENLFLGVNELEKMRGFITDSGYKQVIQSIVSQYGIVENDDNANFEVILKSGTTNTITVSGGIAFDADLNPIVLKSDLDVNIVTSTTPQWIVLSYNTTNLESGYITVDTDGSVTGIGTEFTSVLRGQPDFPNKIRFNGADYEVVSVTSDTSAIITGVTEKVSGVQYSVVGTFTPGFQATDGDKLIYEYDSYSVNVVESDIQPTVSDTEFVLAKITFDELTSAMTVDDYRYLNIFNKNNDESTVIENSIVNLNSVGVVGGVNAVNTLSAELELILEHGYTVDSYELITSGSTNLFTITGSNGFLGTSTLPDNIFNSWLLINRNNMISVEINSNVGNALYLNTVDPNLITDDSDFIIVPNVREIEYEIKVSGNVFNPTVPFYFKKSNQNSKNRCRVYLMLPYDSNSYDDSVTISVKSRNIYDNAEEVFKDLQIATFVNISGNLETLGESSFDVDVAQLVPTSETKNYS